MNGIGQAVRIYQTLASGGEDPAQQAKLAQPLEHVQRKLTQLTGQALESAACLECLRERLFGEGSATAGAAIGNGDAQPSGQLPAILSQIEALEAALVSVHAGVRGLEGRL